MGINGPEATACYGGLGTYVCRGENRVNDLECHANCLRERLDRLEAMLPTALIEASIAIQKGEAPSDLMELKKAGERTEQSQLIAKSGDKRDVEFPCMKSTKILEEDDEPRVCMLQVLARKEKRLRKKIYEMELKEQRYKKALAEAGQTLNQADVTAMTNDNNPASDCQPQCPGNENQTMMTYRGAMASSKNRYDEPVQQRIQQLESSSKQICLNLKNFRRERAELTCKARNLTQELRCTQKCLGEVQQQYLCENRAPRCDNNNIGNCGTKLPQDPQALRNLAGQFKEAYKKAEDEGLSASVREPIRKTAERLRALSNLDPNACPCGQPIKCDSCVICSCAEWERDLEGGGDEPLEESLSDSEKVDKKSLRKSRKELTDSCHCGCNETSSESECPCGCSELHIARAEICPCSCDQTTIESSAISTSDPSTITETTIPSSETDDSGYSQIGRGDESCDLTDCASVCQICKNENAHKSEVKRETFAGDQCEICLCEEPCASQNTDQQLCSICPCACTMCNTIDNQKASPPCQKCRPITEDMIVSNDSYFDTLECTCIDPSELPPGIQKVYKVEKLREGLENLKNRNYAMRNALKACGCLGPIEDSSLAPSPGDETSCSCAEADNKIKQTPSGLMSTVRLLQSKCRTKDGMIVALATELKKAATPEQTSRILECLANPNLYHGVNDFDRSELWNYLKTTSNNKPRVSGRKTCHRDLTIGLIVLFLIIVSHVVRSYSIMPPISEIINSLKYWMEEIPGNVGYLTNVFGDFARILFQKQCFISLLQFIGPLSIYLDWIKMLLWSLPGMETLLTLVKIVFMHVDSACRSLNILARSLRSLRNKFCTQICRVTEYLNVVKRFILFQRFHLPSLKAAIKSSLSFFTSHFPVLKFPVCSITDSLQTATITSYFLSFVKILISHFLCLWTFIVASPNHLRGVNTVILYLLSCMISVPVYIQITLERCFTFLRNLPTRCGIYDRVLPFVSRLLSNLSSLVDSCCCPGVDENCETEKAKNSAISSKLQNTGDNLANNTYAEVAKDAKSLPQSKNLTANSRMANDSQFVYEDF